MNKLTRVTLALALFLIARVASAELICSYEVTQDWWGGFTAEIKVYNSGTELERLYPGDQFVWSYSGDNEVYSMWDLEPIQMGQNNIAEPKSWFFWNATIFPGQTKSFGFQGSKGINVLEPAEVPVVFGSMCSPAEVPEPLPEVLPSCEVSYEETSHWTTHPVGNPFWKSAYSTIQVTVTNTGPNSSYDIFGGWDLEFDVPERQQILNPWNVEVYSEAAANNQVRHELSSVLGVNDQLPVGGSHTFGFWVDRGEFFILPGREVPPLIKPSSFKLNGAFCNRQIERVDNPFEGAVQYHDASWQESVRQHQIEMGYYLESIINNPTAVWITQSAHVESLRDHLDAAIAQGENLVPVVVYNLPNRDCAAEASAGEFLFNQNGLDRYKREFIDPIVDIIADDKYAHIRIVAIIEPDSLPNLVSNVNLSSGGSPVYPSCVRANQQGDGYREGIIYALDQFYGINNVYSYLDIANAGWLGWASGLGVSEYIGVLQQTQAGFNSVVGFTSNTSGYTPTSETVLRQNPDAESAYNGTGIIDNNYLDELQFVQAFRQGAIDAGMPENIGMLIDTSRNGGRAVYPGEMLQPSGNALTDVQNYSLDRRSHRGNWCNQPGGLGMDPIVAPEVGIDAYLWVKKPGESDGTSNENATRFDPMCKVGGVMTSYHQANSNIPTNAMAAPEAGEWNRDHFEELLRNANPSLSERN